MIETPRAALTSGGMAEIAEFFSFGTNDMTQLTMGLSRDDAGRFLPEYVDQQKSAIFVDDPFQSLDRVGVGALVRMSVEQGRARRAGLKLGVCGEHGGDPSSIHFFEGLELDYVSCSPPRVPVARLAAAQAAILHQRKPRKAAKPARIKKAKAAKAQAGRSGTKPAKHVVKTKTIAKRAPKPELVLA
jgi:pyruvate,orthophosphate dikinase